jgi:DNA-binding helix-hairpin-helix protein with protein kinase domain
MELFDSSGRLVRLDRELFRGGEGSIRPVVGDAAVLAKLYHARIDPLKQAKLAAMTRTTLEPLQRVAAWPSATLHAGAGGPMVGFLMPRFDGQRLELHQLYTPVTRKQSFRKADWAFLIHAARNVAAAVATVHAAGHVVGDINQRNFIVGGDATVKVLDCDSFQIREGGRTFFCEVGMPEFIPPELQNRSLAGIERTPNHDGFGLAVLCFQLLFMGRHPFAGRFLGKGEMPIERAIVEQRFAFGRNSRAKQMETPPNMPRFDTLPPRLTTLFEAAFDGAASRPTAKDWTAALDYVQSELRACTAEPMHKYYKALAQCPWCHLESASSVYFFIGVLSARAATFDLARLWAEIVADTGLPYEAPARPTFTATGAPAPSGLRRRRRTAIFAKVTAVPVLIGAATMFPGWIGLCVLLLLVVMLLPFPGAAERKRRQVRFREAERAWVDTYARCERDVSVAPLQARRAALAGLKNLYDALPAQKQSELGSMTANARSIQMQRYLEQEFIRNHSIPDVGPKRKATLAMWGIVTAADVSWQSLARVQGFGPTLQRRLIAWRATLESRFVFDLKRAIPQQDLDAFEYRWQRRKIDLEQQLHAGAAEARHINECIRQRRGLVAKELEMPARAWAQARAAVDALARRRQE